MNKYPKSILISVLIVVCIAFVIELLHRSPPSVPVPEPPTGPGCIIISTMDLQRALNRLYPDVKLEVDGVYGALTQAAHERAVGDQYAKELMVWEVE